MVAAKSDPGSKNPATRSDFGGTQVSLPDRTAIRVGDQSMKKTVKQAIEALNLSLLLYRDLASSALTLIPIRPPR